MVAFKKQRVQHDEETKRIIYEEYTTTRKSMAQVAEKYNINVNTVNNIVKKFKAQKKKEEQFFKDNGFHSKPSKPKPLSVAQEVNRIEHNRKQNYDKPKQTKQSYEPQQKPQNELRKSARRERLAVNTSQGMPAEPFRPRPQKLRDDTINFDKTEKKLDRRSSLANIADIYFKRTFDK